MLIKIYQYLLFICISNYFYFHFEQLSISQHFKKMGICQYPSICGVPQLESFFTKNIYNSTQPQSYQKIKIILDHIAPGQQQQKFKSLAAYISQQKKEQFVDKNFLNLQENNNQKFHVNRIQKLYNFSRLRLQRVYKNFSTPFDIINQQQVQFCYLSCVFYLICNSPQLKQRIFITNIINAYNAYILKLFCNGKPQIVVIDNNLPVRNNNLKYLSIRKPQQIWPFLLEKAWCKQIGNYNKARGLSPQDCFEEITGIPAQSYKLSKYSINLLIQNFKKDYWIVLTAKQDSKKIFPRQVFKLQNINQQNQSLTLRSPYQPHSYVGDSRVHRNFTQFNFSQVMSQFQYVTIGYNINGYVPISYPLVSQKNEEKIFVLKLNKPGNISVRLIQFYHEYLSEQKKQQYDYSPVLLQLYDQNKKIILNAQGKLENLSGIRSSNLSENILIDLKSGIYYLRVQILWLDEKLFNFANIIVYAGKNMATLNKYQGDTLGLSSQLLGNTIQKSNKEVIKNQQQQLSVSYFSKSYGHIVGIKNQNEKRARLKIIFKNSYNIRINHNILVDNTLQIQLEGNVQTVLQIFPQNPKKPYLLAPFDIEKF